MRRSILAVAVAVAAVMALPGASGAQAPPTQDSVVLTGGPGVVSSPSAGPPVIDLEINATSGPSGENPTGHAQFRVLDTTFYVRGPVTCLRVSGNTATINFQDTVNSLGVVTMQVVDNNPDTFQSAPGLRASTDCSPLPPDLGIVGPLSTGDIVVVDAPPLPTTVGQCLHGGYAQFGFRNVGQCVVFVVQTRICAILDRYGIKTKFCPPEPPRRT